MKNKIFLLLFTLFFSVFFSCKESVSSSNMPNLKSVKDFQKYTAIGAGTFNQSSRTVRSIDNSILIEAADGTKLVGELQDGSLELVTFTDIEGNITEQTWNLSVFHIDSNFAFLGFTQNTVTSIKSDTLNSDDANYVLDLKDGNLYSVDVFTFIRIGADSLDEEENPITIVRGILNDIEGVYFFSISDSKLKIELKYSVDVFNVAAMNKSDRYKNIVDSEGFHFFVKGKYITDFSQAYQVRLNKYNNIFYIWNYDDNTAITNPAYKIDENGQIVINNDNLPFYDDYISNCIYEEGINDNGEEYFCYYKADTQQIEGVYIDNFTLHTVVFNEDKSSYTDVVTKTLDITEKLLASDGILILEKNVIEEKGSEETGDWEISSYQMYYKYTVSTDTLELLINTKEYTDKIVNSQKYSDAICLWYYDDNYDKQEFYIYADGSTGEEFNPSIKNYEITFLTPIA